MIEFMVLGLPRSGTTWAANWLTTDTTLCLHDPIATTHYRDLDSIRSHSMLGISCTGTCMFVDWVNNHPARKVILHRDITEIRKSLELIGLNDFQCDESVLNRINGRHHHWEELFDNPQSMYEFLLEKPFNKERHNRLVDMNIQPNLSRMSIDPGLILMQSGELRGSH